MLKMKMVMRPARESPLYTLTCSHTLFSRHQGQVVENEHKLNRLPDVSAPTRRLVRFGTSMKMRFIMSQFYRRHKSQVVS